MSGGQLARSIGTVAMADAAVSAIRRDTNDAPAPNLFMDSVLPGEADRPLTAGGFDDHVGVTYDEHDEFDSDVEAWDDWETDDWVREDEISSRTLPASWRVIGIVAALSMLAIPIFNLIDARSPQIADNGLEVCRFDYCIVEQFVVDAGLGRTMAEMSSIIVPDADVQSFVDAMIDVVGGPSVTAEVVDELPGDLGGRYSPAERLIQIDRPATVWIIAHEVAHTVSPGHDEEFRETLVELGRFFERSTG